MLPTFWVLRTFPKSGMTHVFRLLDIYSNYGLTHQFEIAFLNIHRAATYKHLELARISLEFKLIIPVRKILFRQSERNDLAFPGI